MDAMLIPTFFCPKPWEGMTGNETTRFCTYCKKHVHNLEAMSVQERLRLLSSPAGSICARYQVAIRRPIKGKEESYARHLTKYGAGVAAAGAVLITLWEMQEPDGRGTFYRAVANFQAGFGYTMPGDFYEERRTLLLGDIAVAPGAEMPEDLYIEESAPILGVVMVSPPVIRSPDIPETPVIDQPFVDLKFDPSELIRFEEPFTQVKPTPAAILNLQKRKK